VEAITLSVEFLYCDAECRYAECRGAAKPTLKASFTMPKFCSKNAVTATAVLLAFSTNYFDSFYCQGAKVSTSTIEVACVFEKTLR